MKRIVLLVTLFVLIVGSPSAAATPTFFPLVSNQRQIGEVTVSVVDGIRAFIAPARNVLSASDGGTLSIYSRNPPTMVGGDRIWIVVSPSGSVNLREVRESLGLGPGGTGQVEVWTDATTARLKAIFRNGEQVWP